jgi:pimeloyl-ACP methyl ester carboxylesterase
VYDRAGYGWSDSGPTPRTGQQTADELHTLLSTSNLSGPYVLVGHSFSGFTVRLYQHHYPQDVAGMLLVDVGHEDQFTHPEFRAYYDWNSSKNTVMRGAAALGIIRLAMFSNAIPRLILIKKFWIN